jgi:hypothetical protein
VASSAGKKDARAVRERARLYEARQQFHDGRVRRRRRDNLIAGVAGGLLIVAVLGAQTLYYTAGPGVPAPTPTPTTTVAPTPAPDAPTPTPDAPTPAPDASTPAPSPSETVPASPAP